MAKFLLLVLLVAAGGVRADVLSREYWLSPKWEPPAASETALLVGAEALIVVDALQTLDVKNHPDLHEMNALLGPHPTDARILGMSAAAMVGTAVAWYLLPEPWRNVLTGGIVAYEVPNTVKNAMLGCRIAF
ncbi:MAG: hypothetical protein ACXWLR_07470 [Myxococcales bacterium]